MQPLEKRYHKEMLDKFTDELNIFIFEQNHIYKYGGTNQILLALNRICEYINSNCDTTLSFSLTKDNTLRCESDNIEYEITLLPQILLQFKKCYRCQRCLKL